MVDFGGWHMPVQYSGIIEEHKRVREYAGLFDVSHMGEFVVKGKDAFKFIQKIITNDLTKIEPNKAIYSPMCYDHGGTIDDLLVYAFTEEEFWLVVNASNIEKDWEWVNSKVEGDVEITNISKETAQIAIQGPKALSILAQITDIDLNSIKYFRFLKGKVAGIEAIISRTGYTGEDGFELYLNSYDALNLWENILEVGAPQGLAPIGLGARDTLRLEARLPLYGHELSPTISPLEAGLGMFVKTNTDIDFIGREPLVEEKRQGSRRKLVGMEMVERGIPREGYKVVVEEEIGFITSGTFSPTLGKNIGLALIGAEHSQVGQEVDIMIRNKPHKAIIVKTPFYKREE